MVVGAAVSRSQEYCRVPANASPSRDRGGHGVGAVCQFGGLIRGEWIAIDGSKFRAVSSISSVHERVAVERYLESLETADREDEPRVENSAVAAALEKLRRHVEPEAGFMKTAQGMLPAYNVQTAVDAEHGLIVAQQVSDEPNDTRSLLPMAEAAQRALGEGRPLLKVVADAGYSNGEQAAACESKGILPHVPAHRGVNVQGGANCLTAPRSATRNRTTPCCVRRDILCAAMAAMGVR